MTKYVYLFHEGNASMRELLGGKGANLAEMTNIHLPVPQGFTITTEACNQYYQDGRVINDEIWSQITKYICKLEEITGKKFGDKENPLLVSVRSGARASMPGMMDTILNLGLNEEVVNAIAKKTNNPRWAWDCYRRFIQMFSDVVAGVGKNYFEKLIDHLKSQRNIRLDSELTAKDLQLLVEQFKAEYKKQKGVDFPDNPKEQIFAAIEAVFRSWDNPRANVYRYDHGIPYSWGTAVNIQMMVFGNLSDISGTGVAFTRSPANGDKGLVGEFLMNAQGEDVVAGVRTPLPIEKMKEILPEVYDEFLNICKILEDHYRDMQDMEFTIENKKLYMLQTRNGKRTASAAIKIACDLLDEGKINEQEALMQIDAKSLDMLLHPQFNPNALKEAVPIGKGIAASPGAASGKIVFTASKARELGKQGEKVILVRMETSPEDIEGMKYAKGILTVRGGQTSHAAIVARGMGTCCVSGCEDINMADDHFELNGKTFVEGNYLSLDGSTGLIYDTSIPMVPADPNSSYFGRIMQLADKYRTMKIRVNADTVKDVKQALNFKAEGIGLCRSEHMFFDPERITAFQSMILADNLEERQEALDIIEPMQQGDFEELFEAMQELPVTIRLLDPPLHEFLPTSKEDIKQLSKIQGKPVSYIEQIITNLHEINPMMGYRGCRLMINYPEIATMQTRAIIKAALNVKNRHPNWKIKPEIMVPLVGDVSEFKELKNIIVATANKEIAAAMVDLKYEVGSMIEIPRAALSADEIATEADFFCFGTNDLTQMTFGFSRDDANKFLPAYYKKKIYEFDPFMHLDLKGPGKLMEIAVKLAKAVNKELHYGICGEHGGDPRSIEFCQKIGLNYVSCSPYRIPIARLAAAQSRIKEMNK